MDSSSGSDTASVSASGSGPRPFWDPRRSLSTRLLWLLLAVTLLPALGYRAASVHLVRRSREELTSLLLEKARDRERGTLRLEADRRVQQVEQEMTALRVKLREAAALAVQALEAGPSPQLPPEPLVDVPGRPLRTADRKASSALVSRGARDRGRALRDLAATRRLEESFAALVIGHGAFTSAFLVTSSGVLRTVPACDMNRLAAAGGLASSFAFGSDWTLSAEGKSGNGELPVILTAPYDDPCGRRGRIVTAMAPLRSGGVFLGEVGLDWVFGDLFGRAEEVRRPGETEWLFGEHGTLMVRLPASGTGAEPSGAPDASEMLRLVSGRGSGDWIASLGGAETLLVSRRVGGTPWLYVLTLPIAQLRRDLEKDVDPAFLAAFRRQEAAGNVYFGLIAALAALAAVTAWRATRPLRLVARLADAITAGTPLPPLTGTDRRDEVGRLARAIADLDRKVRRRARSMEGVHELAQTGAVMTSPDETYGRLTRRIAELVGATKSLFCLWNAETRALDLTVPGYGIPAERLVGSIGLEDRSLAMLAYRTGEPFVSNEILTDPRASRRLADSIEVKQNAVFVPLKTEAGVLGVLVVADKPERFDAEDLAAVQSYADQAALLLRNARLYEELQLSYERLRDAHRNRDHFLQNINHELRTPLTAILGWSEVLAEDRPDPVTVESAVEQIRRSAQFLLTLISDLLDLSRFDEGGVRIEHQSVDLAGLVSEAIEPVAVMAQAKGIVITVAVPPAGSATVRLDPLRMRQVLWNLVHNAVKFTPKGGRIDVEAHGDEESGVFVTVTDDGVGIDPKDLPFIFERFRQGDGSATRAFRGTGIGLALAKAYVELHGGQISVESRPGRGARFLIRIPSVSASGRMIVVQPTTPASRLA